jgi:hypothetical protein
MKVFFEKMKHIADDRTLASFNILWLYGDVGWGWSNGSGKLSVAFLDFSGLEFVRLITLFSFTAWIFNMEIYLDFD